MRTTLFVAVAIALPTTVLAQTYATIPSGHLTTDAPNETYYFGGYPDMRCQIFNSEHTSNVRVFTEVAGRLDGGRSSTQFPARNWTNVLMQVAEGSYASASTTFTANLTTNPKTVFNQAVSWTGITGTSPNPGVWGAPVRFPFSAPYIYTGSSDLVLDFTFTGGTLANAASWTGLNLYYIDGATSVTSVGGGSVNMGTNNCLNTGHTSGPFCVPVYRTHAVNTGNPTTSNNFEFNWWLYRYPQSVPVAFALSLTGSTAGVNIGNPCNNLFLGPGPLLIMMSVTPASTGSYMFPSPSLYAPYVQAAVGLRIYTQAAWTHPTRNQFELSRGGYADTLAQPVPFTGTKWMYATTSTAPTSSGIRTTQLPVLRAAY